MSSTFNPKRAIVAIDGPAGSGKSTTARLVARRLDLRHLDTGAMYRAVTLAALQQGTSLNDAQALSRLAEQRVITVDTVPDDKTHVLLDGTDVSDRIRERDVTSAVSEVSAHAGVRRAMVRLQRKLAEEGGVVLEGRDIGSVVLPWADVKIYLDASVPERARRRQAELRAKGIDRDTEQVVADIEARDAYDTGREESPLKVPVGAFVLDNTGLSVEEQVERVAARVDLCQQEAQDRAAGPRFDRSRLIYHLSRTSLQGLSKLLFGLKIIRKYRPERHENYIFASNHVSNVDPPLIGNTVPRETHFIAKRELFQNPVFGRLIRYYNAIPIKRGGFDQAALDRGVEILSAGKAMMIFPEGTRQRNPDGALGQGRSGVAYLALHTGVPVMPMYGIGTNALKKCLFRHHPLIVAHGRPIRIPIDLREQYNDRAYYRDYAAMVMAAISALKDDVAAGLASR